MPGNEPQFSLVDDGGISFADGSYPPGFFDNGAEAPSGSIFAGGGYEVADSGQITTDAQYAGSSATPDESPALSSADQERLANQNGLPLNDNWTGHAGANEIGLTIYGARGGASIDSADYIQSLTDGATIGAETGFFRTNPVGQFFATAAGDLAAVPLSVFRSDGDVVNPLNGYSLTPEEIFNAKFGLVTSVLGEATSLAATVGKRTLGAIEGAVSDAGESGVYFFDKEVLPYIDRADATLGQAGNAQFFMPLSDSSVVVDAASAARYSGGAPSLERAYASSGQVFGVEFPTVGLSPRLPTSGDTTLEHFLEGGRTALKLPNGGGYMINPTREFVVPGGGPMPSGSVLFKIEADGTQVPLRNW